MKPWITLFIGAVVGGLCLEANAARLASPSGRLHLEYELEPRLKLHLKDSVGTRVEIAPLSFTWSDANGTHVFRPESILQERTEKKNTLHLTGANGSRLEIALFDELLAFRFHLRSATPFTLIGDSVDISIRGLEWVRGQSQLCDTLPDCFHSPHEGRFERRMPSPLNLILYPVLAKSAGRLLYLSDMDVGSHAGTYLQFLNAEVLRLQVPRAPAKTALVMEGEFELEQIVSREDYTGLYPAGHHDFPWRYVRVLDSETDLLSKSMTPLLAKAPSQTADYSWVEPGFGIDEWIVDATIDFPETELGFPSGINTPTYKYYIDFAQDFGVKYVMLDAGWSEFSNIYSHVPQMDVASIMEHARKRGIKIILWTQYSAIRDDLETKLQYLKNLGASAIMVDFIGRDDVAINRFMQRLFAGTFQNKLMLMLHGVAKPAGQDITHPHVMTFEAGLGHEYNKWSTAVTTKHKLDLIFFRNLVGSFDYEGASFKNVWPWEFQVVSKNPEVMGTRTNEVSMYVFLDSKFQMIAGNVADYLRNPHETRFLTQIPVRWDEVIPIQAELDDHAVVAKRSGSTWYLAAISAREERRIGGEAFQVQVARFLLPGKYRVSSMSDCFEPGATADCSLLKVQIITIEKNSVLEVPVTVHGGYVARIEKL